ncbi:MAG TPA: hypothetical protein VH518_08125 [Tepidisphaeraceae bacterium]|jgi:hypothetical protein
MRVSKPRRTIFDATVAVFVLATASLWLRSLWVVDGITWTNSSFFVNLFSSGGRVVFTWFEYPNRTASPPGWSFSRSSRAASPPFWESGEPQHGWRFAGFEHADWWPMGNTNKLSVWFFVPTHHLTAVPYWFILTLLLTPIALLRLLVSLRSRSRARRMLCAECGYDLRASRERCPECGTPTGHISKQLSEQSAAAGVRG